MTRMGAAGYHPRRDGENSPWLVRGSMTDPIQIAVVNASTLITGRN